MSFSVGGSSGSSSGTQTVDPEIKDQWLDLVGQAKSAAHTPYQDYLGAAGDHFLNSDASHVDRLVAPQNQAQQTGRQISIDNARLGLNSIGQAVDTLGTYARGVSEQPTQAYTASGITSQSTPTYGAVRDISAAPASGITTQSTPSFGAVRDVNAGQLATTNLSPYLSPYTNDVVNQSLNDIDQQRQRAIAGNSSDATANGGEGAWRGSRAGVADALTNSAALHQAAETSAQLRQAGYGQALNSATQDIANRQAADISNQNVDYGRAGQVFSGTLQNAQHNQDAYNDLTKFNSQQNYNQQAANQAADQARAGAVYGGTLATNQGNQQAWNDLAKFNAQQQQAASSQNSNLFDNELSRAVQSAGMLTGAAQAQQTLGQQQGQAWTDAGNAQQQQQQNVLNALQQSFQNQTNFPSYQLGLQESAFGLAPKIDNGSVSHSNSTGKSAGVGG